MSKHSPLLVILAGMMSVVPAVPAVAQFRPSIGVRPTIPASVIGGRVQCIRPGREGTTLLGPTAGPVDVTLLCSLSQQAELIAFRFEGRAQVAELNQILESGFSAWISYDKTPLSGAAEGRPTLHAATGIAEAMQDRAQVACVSNYSLTPVSLSLQAQARSGAVTMWCTDGTWVAPLRFDAASLSGSMPIENGPIYIRYSRLSGSAPRGHFAYKSYQMGPYPARDAPFTRAVATKDTALTSTALNNDPRGWGPDFHRYTLVDDPLVGGILLCSPGATPNECMAGPTRLDVFVSDAVRGAASPTKTGSYDKSVTYAVLPGIVAPEFRSQTGGASRVVAGAEVRFRSTEKFGTGTSGR